MAKSNNKSKSIKSWLISVRLKLQVYKVKANHKKAIKRVQKQDKIKIAFLVIYKSIWKYEKLYTLLKNDPKFEPVIYICPFITYGEEIMKEEMETSYNYFKSKDYTTVKTLGEKGEFLDIKTEHQPDIVFFTNPWNHTLPQYLIKNFLDTLTCYVPYGFNSSNLYKVHYNMDAQNFLWKYFIETDFHQELAFKYSPRKGDNTVVSGFPGLDNLLSGDYKPQSVWKAQNIDKKKIIWAPHHTIPQYKRALDYSTFLDYADFMLEIADKYKDQIQICFKPHPNLKGKLFQLWGQEKTNQYYEKWDNLENGQINEGDYIDLFAGSDGLIHDSGSFVFEYFLIDKPALFLIANDKVKEQFNDLGKEALENMYLAYSKSDIEGFIQNVLLNGEDKLEEKRKEFQNKLLPSNKKLASYNIFNDIKTTLNTND